MSVNRHRDDKAVSYTHLDVYKRQVEDVRRQYAWEKGLKVTVFIPNGKEKAEKTLNPMLGIVGGLSVLGTTGIVEPMSEKALIDTIAVDIRMHRAQTVSYTHLDVYKRQCIHTSILMLV